MTGDTFVTGRDVLHNVLHIFVFKLLRDVARLVCTLEPVIWIVHGIVHFFSCFVLSLKQIDEAEVAPQIFCLPGTSCAFSVFIGKDLADWKEGRMDGSQQKYTAEHWLGCAEEVRAAARRIKDPKIRNEMEIIGRLYERLAAHTGRRVSRRAGTEVQILR